MTATDVDRAPRAPNHGFSMTVHGRGRASSGRIRAGSPDAVLSVVPLLLGFMPESSLILIGTEPPKGTVKLTLRYDLPDPPDTDLAADIAEHALATLDFQDLSAAIAIGYGPDALVRPLAVAFRDAMANQEPGLIDFLRVEGDRYWSYTCTDENCCPAVGVPFDQVKIPADMAGEGAPVLADRAAVAASIAPVTGAAAQTMRQATRRAEKRLKQVMAEAAESGGISAYRRAVADAGLSVVADMISAYRNDGQYASNAQVARLTVALQYMRIRDDAWARMDPRYTEAHLLMWIDVVRRAQPGHVAAPASLLAFTAWQSGDGALANVALDRALADDPDYSMAGLLRQVISAGAPPSMAKLSMTPEEVAAYYRDEDEAIDECLADDDEEDEFEDEEYDDEDQDCKGEDEEYELPDGPCPVRDPSPDDQAE